MAGNKKTVFNKLWLDQKLHPEYSSWLEEVNGNSNQASCKICKVAFGLSNMGRQAVSSHATSAKHQKYITTVEPANQRSLKSFFAQPSIVKSASPVVPASNESAAGNSTDVPSLAVADVGESSVADVLPHTSSTPHQPHGIAGFVTNNSVTKAEVLWAMKCIMSHFSMNSSKDMKEIFQLMFTDSSIAKKITIGSTKLSYYITYGLAPYFHNSLLRSVLSCSKVVVCFDEAMNRVAQRGQMDIVLRFWSDVTNTVCSHYFGSAFMGHATAENLLTSFKLALTEVPLKMIMQVSMDGPSVNWKFVDLLTTSLGEDTIQILELGSCGLHVIHGAFQTGHKASGWNVNAYLRALYGIFKDSPARKADYIRITGSNVFAKKFCQVRWVENVDVAERALEVLPNVKKFTENVKKLPTNFTCTTIQELCADKLAPAKISFFASVGAQCEPFLRKYQTPLPVAPFLLEDISHLLRVLMKRFVKKSVLEPADTVAKLMKVDVTNKDNRCNYKEVDIGVGATKALSLAKLCDAERMSFRMDCLQFLSATVAKIVERSPLRYGIVRAISCLVPSNIASTPVLAERRMQDLAQTMYEKGCITAVAADKCKSQFTDLVSKAASSLRAKFSGFSRSRDRLDAFYFDIIGQDTEYADLFSVVRLVLTLSHGNASVESGFSVNADMLVENLHEDSLVAQRIVYDGVQSAGGVTSVNIDNAMLSYVRGSHARYQEALKRKREAESELDKQQAGQKRAAEHIKLLTAKKAKLVQDTTAETHKLDMEIAELKRLKTD